MELKIDRRQVDFEGLLKEKADMAEALASERQRFAKAQADAEQKVESLKAELEAESTQKLMEEKARLTDRVLEAREESERLAAEQSLLKERWAWDKASMARKLASERDLFARRLEQVRGEGELTLARQVSKQHVEMLTRTSDLKLTITRLESERAKMAKMMEELLAERERMAEEKSALEESSAMCSEITRHVVRLLAEGGAEEKVGDEQEAAKLHGEQPQVTEMAQMT